MVLEAGAHNINGSARAHLGPTCHVVGVDIAPGDGVDVRSLIHELKWGRIFDGVICTEMLEHDPYWHKSVWAMLDMIRPGGWMLLTCAGPGREEHGTTETDVGSNPGILWLDNHYENIEPNELEQELDGAFTEQSLEVAGTDLLFWGEGRI